MIVGAHNRKRGQVFRSGLRRTGGSVDAIEKAKFVDPIRFGVRLMITNDYLFFSLLRNTNVNGTDGQSRGTSVADGQP